MDETTICPECGQEHGVHMLSCPRCGRHRPLNSDWALVQIKQELRSNSGYPFLRALIEVVCIASLVGVVVFGGVLYSRFGGGVYYRLGAVALIVYGILVTLAGREISHARLDLVDAALEKLRRLRNETTQDKSDDSAK